MTPDTRATERARLVPVLRTGFRVQHIDLPAVTISREMPTLKSADGGFQFNCEKKVTAKRELDGRKRLAPHTERPGIKRRLDVHRSCPCSREGRPLASVLFPAQMGTRTRGSVENQLFRTSSNNEAAFQQDRVSDPSTHQFPVGNQGSGRVVASQRTESAA